MASVDNARAKIDGSRPSVLEPMDHAKAISVSYYAIGLLDGFLPTPGVITTVDVPYQSIQIIDSKVSTLAPKSDGIVSYSVDVPDTSETNRKAALPPGYPANWLSRMTKGIPQPVVELARKVTAGATTDYARCVAIQKEIGNRCKYDT